MDKVPLKTTGELSVKSTPNPPTIDAILTVHIPSLLVFPTSYSCK